jgi:hypothetical protein
MNPIASAVPGAIAAMLRSAPLSPGKVDFAWKTAVGPALQRVTAVRLEGDVLIVETASAQWSREVGRATRVILARLQHLLGEQTVKTIQVRSRN